MRAYCSPLHISRRCIREQELAAKPASATFSTLRCRLEAFAPQLVMISAGFDAHRLDPLAYLNLDADDYAWITTRLVEVANRHAEGRIVSSFEGGYSLTALRESTAAHVAALMA